MLTDRLKEGKCDDDFYLVGYPEITDAELGILAAYPWMGLALDCSAIDDKRLTLLTTTASARRNVQQLGLWNAQLLTDRSVDWIAKAFGSVRQLQLGDCTGCTNDALKVIPDVAKLSDLTLDRWTIDGAGLEHLRRMTRLKRLTLADLVQFNSANLALLDGMFILALCLANSKIDCAHLPLLKGIRGLSVLDLNGIGLTDDGLEGVCSIATLEALTFEEESEVTDAGITHVAKLQRLQRLCAGSPSLSDTGAKTVVQLPNLRELRLAEAQITDATVKALGERKQLSRLALINCVGVTDKSESALSGLVNLEHLSLRGTAITKGAFDRLQAALPKCKMRMN